MPDIDLTFFLGQTVFLTGGTGCLGGCLLYKLVLELGTSRIYVLVRESPLRALAQWRRTMPFHINDILAKGNIQFMVGDMTAPNLGLDPALLAEMSQRVTVVINNSAGNTSLRDPLRATVQNNCLPALELARLALAFTRLVRFVHISTAYVNSHLPSGVVEERIYDIGDPEAQLLEVLETGDLVFGEVPKFMWPYAFAKNLTERLLVARHPELPILIVRPTIIDPALTHPHPFYGPQDATPMSLYMHTYFTHPDSGIFHLGPEHPADRNVTDEIPVDFVANTILLHTIHGTAGIVHASAQIFGTRTLAEYAADMRATGMFTNLSFILDTGVPEGTYAKFWKIIGRNWRFEVIASEKFKSLEGLLSVDVKRDILEEFMAERARQVADQVRATKKLRGSATL
ncbi:male sterility protein-domain-containing protein [Mycena rebaudengoi]|nr:male sterility protein-domain-containing protein [Mycena rebaudengoi]